MPSTGALNLSGTSTPVSANWETWSATGYITMDDSRLRTLAGAGGSGTSYGMNSFYGKSWLVPMTTMDNYTPDAYYFGDSDGYGGFVSVSGPYGYTPCAGYIDFTHISGGAWYQLPGSGWYGRNYSVYNNNSRPQVVNVSVTSYMGMCGIAVAATYRTSPTQVLLGNNTLNTPADWSIYESTATFTDTIPAYTTHAYGVYYYATFYHGVDRDRFGEGFRRMVISFNSWG